MAAMSSILLATGVGMGGLSILNGVTQANAQRTQGEYQRQQFENNAKFAELRAEDSLKRGETEAQGHKRETKKLIGAQRAALAAQGVDVSYGSALDVQEDTAQLGEQDAVTIKNNAWREAWGFKVEASNMRSQGNLASIAGKFGATSSLITGGLDAVRSGMSAVSEYKKHR